MNKPKTIKIPKSPSRAFLQDFLEAQYEAFNNDAAIAPNRLDPLFVARPFACEKVALFCALFAYGNVAAICKFLNVCDLAALANNAAITPQFCTKVYRFQNNAEIIGLAKALSALDSLEDIFAKGFKNNGILGGIGALQSAIYAELDGALKESSGTKFLLGQSVTNSNTSPLKRWNLFLRWMTRKDHIDLGLWSKIPPSALLLPLDTHTFAITRRLGLLSRRSYDFKSVLQATETLRAFDPHDPVKYDFALYRIGQYGLLED